MSSSIVDPSATFPQELAGRLLDTDRLVGRLRSADRILVAEGAGHLVHDLPVRADGRPPSIESRPWRLDPIPLVLDAPTFRWLSAAIAERMNALDAVLLDLHGDRRLISEGIVPAEVVAASPRFRINAVSTHPRRWLTTYAVDLIRTRPTSPSDDGWRVVADHTDGPPGLGYALLGRSVMSRTLGDEVALHDVASLARYPALVRSALAASTAQPSPRTVVFSGGLDDPTYVDHSYLAVQLGVNLVEGPDLVVRQRRLWLRTLDGLEPVDVLYRRVPDPMVDPLEVGARGSVGVPGLLQAVRSGNLSIANAHGSGLLESPMLRPLLGAAMSRLQSIEQPLTPWDERAADDRVAYASFGDDGPHEANVVVRMFAVSDGESVAVLPGGVGRVLAPGDDPRLPTAATAKDVWVIGQTVAPVVGHRLPQVDFGGSVPTRAADALYWTNRSAERAEAMTRSMRVVRSRLEQDPGLAAMHDGAWTRRVVHLLDMVRRSEHGGEASDGVDGLVSVLSLLVDATADEIGALLTEATTVREYLSSTTGRMLAHLSELRDSLQRHRTTVDDLDAVLGDFAALAGLWRESTVRGPAWHIGDAGRRLERCLVVLDLIDAIIDLDEEAPDVRAATIEIVLAANESLVAYRRRHRSDVEAEAAIHLLVHDLTNPRSLAASIETLHEHARDGGWGVDDDFVERAQAALDLPIAELIPAMRGAVADGGAELIRRWFSTPVNPVAMHPTDGGRR